MISAIRGVSLRFICLFPGVLTVVLLNKLTVVQTLLTLADSMSVEMLLFY